MGRKRRDRPLPERTAKILDIVANGQHDLYRIKLAAFDSNGSIDKVNLVIGGQTISDPRSFVTRVLLNRARKLGYVVYSKRNGRLEIHITELGINRLCEHLMIQFDKARKRK